MSAYKAKEVKKIDPLIQSNTMSIMFLRVQRKLAFVLRLIPTSCALDVLGKNEGMDGGVVQNKLVS